MGTCLLHCQKSPGWVLMCHLCCALLPVAVLFVSVCCHLNSCCGAIVCHLGVSGPLSHCCPWRVGWDGFTSATPPLFLCCHPLCAQLPAAPCPAHALEQSVVPAAVQGACARAAAQALRLWGIRPVEGLVPRKTVLL